MARWILLLRGVNVGGVRLAMAGFSAALAEAGCLGVRTLIQSGNAVFDAPMAREALAQAIGAALFARTGLRPVLFLFTPAEFEAILDGCPFLVEAAAEGRSVHVFFLSAPAPVGCEEALRTLAAPGERLHLTPRALYLHLPAGIGRSALGDALPRLLGPGQTGRNWNTVTKLCALAAGGRES